MKGCNQAAVGNSTHELSLFNRLAATVSELVNPTPGFVLPEGPYLNDVYTIFRILDPLPPCLHFGKIHKTKSTQPPLLRLHFVNPPSPLSVDVI